MERSIAIVIAEVEAGHIASEARSLRSRNEEQHTTNPGSFEVRMEEC